jgi:hypothetical protein
MLRIAYMIRVTRGCASNAPAWKLRLHSLSQLPVNSSSSYQVHSLAMLSVSTSSRCFQSPFKFRLPSDLLRAQKIIQYKCISTSPSIARQQADILHGEKLGDGTENSSKVQWFRFLSGASCTCVENLLSSYDATDCCGSSPACQCTTIWRWGPAAQRGPAQVSLARSAYIWELS